MSSSVPIVRQIAWLSVLPQIAVLLLLGGIAYLLGASNPGFAGAIAYLVIAFVLRLTISRDHRRGIGLYKQERFAEAIPHFFASYEFFARHAWVDRWRAVTMLSSSRISYREMGLLNAAFCLAQTGQRERAIDEYRRVLLQFPGSKMAESALKMLEPRDPNAAVPSV